jgi:sugar-specific transcriptional regulator TrmB
MHIGAKDVSLLKDLGLGTYEINAYLALLSQGTAAANDICARSGVPSSKIYAAMERLQDCGLVQIQRTRPKLFLATPLHEAMDRILEFKRTEQHRFEAALPELEKRLQQVMGESRSRVAFASVELGEENHTKRHVVHLARAERATASLLSPTCVEIVQRMKLRHRFDIRKIIDRHDEARNIHHRYLFSVPPGAEVALLPFLQQPSSVPVPRREARAIRARLTPFHVVDDEVIILGIDHPLARGMRVASLLIRDRTFARDLLEGFDAVWEKAIPVGDLLAGRALESFGEKGQVALEERRVDQDADGSTPE